MTRRRRLPFIAPLLVVLALVPRALASQDFAWYDRGPYRSVVPRPDSLLGRPMGSRHTLFHEQQQVLDRMIAAAPDRVRTEVIGRTAEGRVMRVLLISAPENISRLDAIRSDLTALADPRATTEAQARDIAARIPAVALLTHSIHGNEPAGFEAALQTVYQLLASDEPATQAILRNVITIINPTQNPDGHERFAAWNNSLTVAGGTDEPGAMEQSEPWSIQGRFNHYRFDMNRDFVAQSQLETKALRGAVQRWRPQVVVDLHSTVAQYFFPPTARPMNLNLGPLQSKWEDRFGRGNAAAFDARGWQYYVRDFFDFFYPGYVDLWPSLTGATGMTYETDGGPEIRLRKEDGTVMTFEMGIAHHHIASMATLGTLAANKVERLVDYWRFRSTGMAEARDKPFKRVVVLPGRDPGHTARVMRLLAEQEIEMTRATAPFASTAAHDYLDGAVARRTFPAGSYVIDIAQPNARLAATMLEPHPTLDPVFERSQLDRFERNRRRGEASSRERYEFYDVTAWAVPLTHDLEAYWTEDAAPVAGDPVIRDAPTAPGSVSGRAQSAYLFPPGRIASARLAMDLLREGFTVGASTRPLRADGRTWQGGAYVVRIQRNDPSIHERIAALAARTGATVTAVQSAYADSGQVGIGGEAVETLHAPKILLAGGDGVSQTAFGDVWFWLEKELEEPVVTVTLAALGRVDLSDYNVLIIPGGSGGRLWGELGASGGDRLKRWVREGGSIITFGGAAGLLSRKEMELTTVGTVGETTEDEKKPAAATDTTLSPTALPGPPLVSPTAPGPERPEDIPGVIGKGTLDRTHWLTFGYRRDHLAVPLNGGFFTPSKRGDNPVTMLGDGLILSGFGWPGNTERLLKGSAWAVVENAGGGKVILFAENPLFRAFWRGTANLVTNAILFGPGK